MKKLFFLLLLSLSANSQNAFRINKTEFFTISTSIDPNGSIKEKGLDFVLEAEYAGRCYLKLGTESFAALTGGYADVHWGVGINFTSGYFEKIRYYAGFRHAIVWRDGGRMYNYGIEGGIDQDITENLTVGLRATYDKRYDQVLFNWEPELKFSGFIRIGYKWNFRR